MRILVTSDLHYNIARSRRPTEELADRMLRAGADVFAFAGDLAATDLAILDRAFALFDSFRGPRLFVPGNHELWTEPGGASLRRYETELAAVCQRCGVHYLDAAPFIAGGVAFVGSVGWYDYTFRRDALGIPLRFYEYKLAPGAAAIRPEFQFLLENRDDIPPALAGLSVRWMDGANVRLGMSDPDFTRLTVDRLRAQLESAVEQVDRIVAIIHHLPFRELVPPTVAPGFAFASAFMGSEMFGELLLEFPQVRDVFCGHAHRRAVVRKDRLMATCVGSTYTDKQYETLDV